MDFVVATFFPPIFFFLIYKANPSFLTDNNPESKCHLIHLTILLFTDSSYFQLLATIRLESRPHTCMFLVLQDRLPETDPTMYLDISDYFLGRLQQFTLSNLCVVHILIFADLNG